MGGGEIVRLGSISWRLLDTSSATDSIASRIMRPTMIQF